MKDKINRSKQIVTIKIKYFLKINNIPVSYSISTHFSPKYLSSGCPLFHLNRSAAVPSDHLISVKFRNTKVTLTVS